MTSPVSTADNGSITTLNRDRLTEWLSSNLKEWGPDDFSVALAQGGRSNLTYILAQGDRRIVLRRPPQGEILPSAHDMMREARVIACLQATDVPVPQLLALCPDSRVLGAPFYIMEYVDGRTFAGAADTAALTHDEAELLSRNFIESLVQIHQVDFEDVGLGDFGRPSGYVSRQIRRWTKQWRRSQTREIPEMDILIATLESKVPDRSQSTLVHGDFRLDNLLISRDGGLNALAIVDWEMSTLGDPLADLGLTLVYWSDGDYGSTTSSVATHTSGNQGFLSQGDLVETYASLSGFEVSQLPFYMALGYFKLAVIFEGIHKRHTLGHTIGTGFDELGGEVPLLISSGLTAISSPVV